MKPWHKCADCDTKVSAKRWRCEAHALKAKRSNQPYTPTAEQCAWLLRNADTYPCGVLAATIGGVSDSWVANWLRKQGHKKRKVQPNRATGRAKRFTVTKPGREAAPPSGEARCKCCGEIHVPTYYEPLPGTIRPECGEKERAA